MPTIPLHRPYIAPNCQAYVKDALINSRGTGSTVWKSRCEHWLESNLGTQRALLTQSCTTALEMAALLIDLSPGDEVIMPSFTFPSTANAFALRGATPVFVDIRPDTLNIDETLIEQAVSKRTKAIVAVHYAGVPCEMDTIMAIAEKHQLFVIEDAAQSILSKYRERYAGTIGHFGALSFHETKNVSCGEGGALLINQKEFIERAEIILEKGTNKIEFLKGNANQYSWQDLGSSCIPSELTASILMAQLEKAEEVTINRKHIWDYFFKTLTPHRQALSLPGVPAGCQHNNHIFYILGKDAAHASDIFCKMNGSEIQVAPHYSPLHLSPAGIRKGKWGSSLNHTEDLAARILRLPIWPGMSAHQMERVTSSLIVSLMRNPAKVEG